MCIVLIGLPLSPHRISVSASGDARFFPGESGNRLVDLCVYLGVQPHRAPSAPRVRRAFVAFAACAATALTLTTNSPPPAGAAPGAPRTTAPDDPGWQVVAVGNGSYRVSWTSPKDLPVGSDRPTITGGGLAFGAPTIGVDGRTVTALVTAGTAPTPGELDVVLSGD